MKPIRLLALLGVVIGLFIGACSHATAHHPYLTESPRNPLHFQQR